MLTGGKLLRPARPLIEIVGKYEFDPDEGWAVGENETLPEDGDCDFDINGGTFATGSLEIRCFGSVDDDRNFEVRLTALSTRNFPTVLSSIEMSGELDDLKSA